MNKILSLTAALSLCCALCGTPAPATTIVENFAAIAAAPSTDGSIVFVYGKDWDAHGEALCRALIAHPAVQEAAGEAALMLAPMLENPTEEQEAHVKAQLGELSLPDAGANDSYPALLFFDTAHRRYSLLCGVELMDNTAPEAVAKLIAARLAALHQRDALVAQAAPLSGVAPDTLQAPLDALTSKFMGESQALKLLASARVEGADPLPDIRDRIRAVDPEDKSRALWALNFDNGALTDEEKHTLSLDAICARTDAYLADPLLTVNQKQRACAYLIGHIHRTTGKSRSDLMVRYARRMHELAPDTVLGRSALIVIRDWAGGER